MVVKDEGRHLPRCLDSVGGLAEETIIVDTGSSDNTKQIAAGYGARVLPFDFTRVDFAAARNLGLSQANGEWILVLDADEMLAAGSASQMESLLAKDQKSGYFLERQNHASDAEEPTTDYVVRLFPNRPEHRYRGRVHETIDASILAAGGRLQKSDIRIHHSFVSDRETRRRKNHWYIQILNEEIEADPTDDTRLDFLAAEYHQLGLFDEAAAIAERIVVMRPNDARAHLFAGLYHLHYQNNAARALTDFARALELRPGYPEAESFLRLAEEQLR
jgi:glycosyltransferase involved in cell wall biosynthesis